MACEESAGLLREAGQEAPQFPECVFAFLAFGANCRLQFFVDSSRRRRLLPLPLLHALKNPILAAFAAPVEDLSLDSAAQSVLQRGRHWLDKAKFPSDAISWVPSSDLKASNLSCLSGTLWISDVLNGASNSARVDAFAFKLFFEVFPDGTCKIGPGFCSEEERLAQLKSRSSSSLFEIDKADGDVVKNEIGETVGAALRLALKGAAVAARDTGVKELNWLCEAARSLQELCFFLWGDPTSTAGVDALILRLWRKHLPLCQNCVPQQIDPASADASPSGLADSETSVKFEEEIFDCNCATFRCYTIRMSAETLDAVVADDIRLQASEKGRLLRGRVVRVPPPLLDKKEKLFLLRASQESCDEAASSDDSEKWLSELPSSDESDEDDENEKGESAPFPVTTPTLCPASSLSNPPCSSEEERRTRRNALLSQLASACAKGIEVLGGAASPLWNEKSLDDATWIVSGAKHSRAASTAGAHSSQLGAARSFMAFECTDSWEVLLLLHAAEAPQQDAVFSDFRDWFDIVQSRDEFVCLRRLQSRELCYALLEEEASLLREAQGTVRCRVPLVLSLVETKALQPGREFRAFCAGKQVVGACQLQLHETFPELLVPAARRRFRKLIDAFVLSLAERWQNDCLPPLFVCDVYVHRKTNGMEICRLLRLLPWGSSTDPLLFEYAELRDRVIKLGCLDTACASCVAANSVIRVKMKSDESRDLRHLDPKTDELVPASELPLEVLSSIQRCSLCAREESLRVLKAKDENTPDSRRVLALPVEFRGVLQKAPSEDVECLMKSLQLAEQDIRRRRQARSKAVQSK